MKLAQIVPLFAAKATFQSHNIKPSLQFRRATSILLPCQCMPCIYRPHFPPSAPLPKSGLTKLPILLSLPIVIFCFLFHFEQHILVFHIHLASSLVLVRHADLPPPGAATKEATARGSASKQPSRGTDCHIVKKESKSPAIATASAQICMSGTGRAGISCGTGLG